MQAYLGSGFKDFLVGLALMLVIEGSLWCLFPDAMRRASKAILGMESALIRGVGLAVAILGVALVWLVRHR